MPKFTNKLAGKKVVVIGGSSGSVPSFSVINVSRIGFGVAEALVSLDAHVIIISSSKEKVDNALNRLRDSASEHSKAEGIAVSASDSNAVVQALKSIGPFDHLVYTAAQFSSLKSDDLDSLKEAFEVKFWGAVNAATGYQYFHFALTYSNCKAWTH
jgi:NAD(P)-dependent dehydrogenase (short-subunit alcohol dehydrogenase family)